MGSDYTFRNSATKRGGFRGNVGYTSTDTDIDIDGSEDIRRSQDLLTEADRADLRSQITKLTACVIDTFCTDRADLKEKAEWAWNRATTLYPTTKALLDEELAALRDDTINRICQREAMWARTAGSSLNCLVQNMKIRAEIELTRELAGVTAKYLMDHKVHETQAIVQAFADNMSAKMNTTQLSFQQVSALYGLLRGARVDDVTDRDYSEDRSENTMVIDARGEFFHEVTSIADNYGEYDTELDDVFTTSQSVAGPIKP